MATWQPPRPIQCDPARLNRITGEIIAAATKIHIQVGPGLLELPLGQLINFRGGTLKEGLHRIVNAPGLALPKTLRTKPRDDPR